MLYRSAVGLGFATCDGGKAGKQLSLCSKHSPSSEVPQNPLSLPALPSASTSVALVQEERLLRGLGLWEAGGSPWALLEAARGLLREAGASPRQRGLCQRRKLGETFEHGDFLALQRCLVLAFRWEPGHTRPPPHGHRSLMLPLSRLTAVKARGLTWDPTAPLGPGQTDRGGSRYRRAVGTGRAGPPPPALTETSQALHLPRAGYGSPPAGPASPESRPHAPAPTFPTPSSSTRRPLLPQPPGVRRALGQVSLRVCQALQPPQGTCSAEGAAGSLLLPPAASSPAFHICPCVHRAGCC